MLNEKGSHMAALAKHKPRFGLRSLASRAGSAGKTGTEFLNAAGFHDASLSACVERVRFGRYIAFEQWIGLAIQFDGFTAVQRRAGNEFGAGLLVQEYDFAIFGMDAIFHD